MGFKEAPTVIDDPELQDGMDIHWAPELVADFVTKWCMQKEASDGPSCKIDIIITFDDEGVSGHTNHKATFHGVKELMTKKMIDVEVMTLTTYGILRKYIGAIDINFILPNEWHAFWFNNCAAYSNLAAHESQLVWFRKFFIILSRYTYVNSFSRYIQEAGSSAFRAEHLHD